MHYKPNVAICKIRVQNSARFSRTSRSLAVQKHWIWDRLPGRWLKIFRKQSNQTKVAKMKRINILKYYNRTAGMFYLFRPCGVRLGNYEIYTAVNIRYFEVYNWPFWWNTTFAAQVGYDRVCDLHLFIKSSTVQYVIKTNGSTFDLLFWNLALCFRKSWTWS